MARKRQTKTPFTDREIAALKPKAERYEVKEPTRSGLGIRVSPNGEKRWTFMYRFGGKQKRMVLGDHPYPLTSVSKAHSLLGEAREKLRQGIDPGAEKAEAKAVERNAETVDDLVGEYIERYAKPNMKPGTAAEDERVLRRDVLPRIGRIKAKEVTRRDLIKLLDEITDRGAPVMRNRTAGVLSRLFRFAMDRGIVDASPAAAIRRTKEEARERVLTMEEIHALWRNLPDMETIPVLPLAIKMILLTGQRRGEVIGARWDEIEDGIWRLPAERTKNGRENVIPLPPSALRLLDVIRQHQVRAMPKKVWKNRPAPDLSPSPYLFPARISGQAVTPQAVSRAVIRNRDILGIGDATIHDLRRTFATVHGRLGTPPEIISALLNHTPQSVTARVYNHATMMERRRAAMLRFDEWLEHVLAGRFDAARAMEGAEVKHLQAVA